LRRRFYKIKKKRERMMRMIKKALTVKSKRKNNFKVIKDKNSSNWVAKT